MKLASDPVTIKDLIQILQELPQEQVLQGLCVGMNNVVHVTVEDGDSWIRYDVETVVDEDEQ